jgi:hypothetical protein
MAAREGPLEKNRINEHAKVAAYLHGLGNQSAELSSPAPFDLQFNPRIHYLNHPPAPPPKARGKTVETVVPDIAPAVE